MRQQQVNNYILNSISDLSPCKFFLANISFIFVFLINVFNRLFSELPCEPDLNVDKTPVFDPKTGKVRINCLPYKIPEIKDESETCRQTATILKNKRIHLHFLGEGVTFQLHYSI